jgi:hypothetical protein
MLLRVGLGLTAARCRRSTTSCCFYALGIGLCFVTSRSERSSTRPSDFVSMPSVSGWALRPLRITSRSKLRSFYALDVGLCVVTGARSRSQPRAPSSCFYALDIGLAFATSINMLALTVAVVQLFLCALGVRLSVVTAIYRTNPFRPHCEFLCPRYRAVLCRSFLVPLIAYINYFLCPCYRAGLCMPPGGVLTCRFGVRCAKVELGFVTPWITSRGTRATTEGFYALGVGLGVAAGAINIVLSNWAFLFLCPGVEPCVWRANRGR